MGARGDGTTGDESPADAPETDRVGADRTLPPGPTGWPVVGNLPTFISDPLAFYERLGHEYESDVVRYTINRNAAYMLCHPGDVKRVLVDDHERFCKGFVNQQTLGEAIEEGLFLAEGEAWAAQRKRLQPAFYRESIESYADAMVDYADRRVGGWADGAVIDLQAEMQALTLEILAHSLFDIDITGGETTVGRASRDVLQRYDSGAVSSWLPHWVPTPINRRFRRGLADLHDVIDDLIAERRASDDVGDDLLSILLVATEAGDATGRGAVGDAAPGGAEAEEPPGGARAEGTPGGDGNGGPAVGNGNEEASGGDDRPGGMTETQLRDEMVTFLLAGHETTSLALTYALFELARTPAAANRVRAEVDDVLDGRQAATLEDMADLSATANAVDESLRLYPPAWAIMREPTEPVTVGGYEIRPGEAVATAPFVVHRDPRWYDDPLEYRPSRWAGDLAERNPEYAYFPFGGGPRACIGMRFAIQEATLALATAMAQVELELLDDSDLPLSVALTLQPGRDVKARVHRRETG